MLPTSSKSKPPIIGGLDLLLNIKINDEIFFPELI